MNLLHGIEQSAGKILGSAVGVFLISMCFPLTAHAGWDGCRRNTDGGIICCLSDCYGTQTTPPLDSQKMSSFHETLVIADLGPGGDEPLPDVTPFGQRLDTKALDRCSTQGDHARRLTDYAIEYGHSSHYTVVALLSADYVCEEQ